MPRWEDPRGMRDAFDRERWGRFRDAERPSVDPGDRRRSFHAQDEAGGPMRRDAALYDQERVGYGRLEEDAGSAGYAHHPDDSYEAEGGYPPRGEADAYHGQEYGVEGRGYDAGEPDPDPGWGLEPDDEERRRNFDLDDPGSGQSQAGYATRSPHEHQFDPDYVRWREEQLRNHDRVYEAWRRRQHQRYDEQHRLSRDRRPGRR